MIPILILYEDEAVLVIEKPSGLLVHAADGAPGQLTVADWIQQRRPQLRDVGGDPTRPGIVHRLDRDTSGIMVIAKTREAFSLLQSQFARHTVKKTYTALVHGSIVRMEGTIAFPIARAHGKRRRGKFVSVPAGKKGKTATTHFVVRAKNPRYTLLTLEPETGRTHQIRAHLAAYGHPIVGDTEYTSKRWKKDDAPRLMLHATTLELTHPTTGKRLSWTTALPKDFQDYCREKKLC